MREIEMKILDIPKSVFLRAMEKIRARKKYQIKMRVKYFDFTDRRIYKKKDLLRIRECRYVGKTSEKAKIGTEVVYKIYKGVRKGCKVFEEIEWRLSGKYAFQYLSDFFANLGLRQTLYYEKKRTLFEGLGVKFEFDEHPKIPPFLEIEASSEWKIHEVLKKLGFENYEKSPETIEQLMKRKYPNIRLDGMRF